MEATIAKLDLVRKDPNYYLATRKPEIRDLDPYYYLSIEGKGSPDNAVFWESVESLYGVAYAVKFRCKSEDNDFFMPKMEGFWWLEGGIKSHGDFEKASKDLWRWKIMIRMPDFVDSYHFFGGVESVRRKKLNMNLIDGVKFELINEGRVAQILHLGGYDEERPTLEKLYKFIEQEGFQINGDHHEIYLSDPRRTPREKLRTILRYAVSMMP